MEIKKITDLIENFAPLELQEAWDCCGIQIGFDSFNAKEEVNGKREMVNGEVSLRGACDEAIQKDIKKILLCVSVTQDIINQAITGNFDLIIAHHPLFFIPFGFNKNIPIYSAHTNLDKTESGTTGTMIEDLELGGAQKISEIQKVGDFLRLVELKEPILLEDFIKLLKEKLNIENLRVVNNLNQTIISKIAFCAGSGADFLHEAQKAKADAFVTGDVKYHTALESNVIIIDVGHFESERPVLKKIKKILEPLNLQVLEADEKSPFINY